MRKRFFPPGLYFSGMACVLNVCMWLCAWSNRHIKRNQYNRVPVGIVKTSVKENQIKPTDFTDYTDDEGRVWKRQPVVTALFHQFPGAKHPNLKFLHEVRNRRAFSLRLFLLTTLFSSSFCFCCCYAQEVSPVATALPFLSYLVVGSSEAILAPNNTYVQRGSKQGTFNYAHGFTFTNVVLHFFLDMLPHFLNEDYASFPLQGTNHYQAEKGATGSSKKHDEL